MKVTEQKAILSQILKQDDFEKLREFIAAKGDLNLRIGYGTILHGAAAANKISLIRALVEAGADVNSLDVYKQIPLNNAESLAAVQILVENGADVFHLDNKNRNVVYFNISFGKYAVTRYLNECRGDVFKEEELQALPPLADDVFWPVVEKEWRAAKNDETWQARYVMMHLRHHDIPAIVAFEKKRALLSNALHTADLWAAASVVNGSCSPAEFSDFKDWIIGFGKADMEKVMQNPDHLLRFAKKKVRYHNNSAYDCPTLSAALSQAYKYRTGLENLKKVAGSKTISGPLEAGFERDWTESELESKKKVIPKIWKEYKGK